MRVTGKIDQDVDSVIADLLCDLIGDLLRDVSPMIDVAFQAVRHIIDL